jgi:hypothetical protein
LDRAASTTTTNFRVDAGRAVVARSGRGKSVSEISGAEAESAWTPETTRETEQTPSTSVSASRKATSGRAATKREGALAAQAQRKPNLETKAAEKPREGRTHAAKWIGVKSRKETRK